MMLSVWTLLLLNTAVSTAFVAPSPRARSLCGGTRASRSTTRLLSTQQDAIHAKLEDVAHKLKLQIYDTTTGVYGFESKDHDCGIETLRADIHIAPSLGLELTELAHSDSGDDRGLVLVSAVSGHAAEESNIMVGDTIIGVFSEPDFKETTTAYAYDETMDVIARAKQHAIDHDHSKISLELNRLVSRSTVTVIVEDGKEGSEEIEALAGDNLRSLLLHHHLKLYDDRTPRLDQPHLCTNCGGEGICGTCLVAVREGMSSLNTPPPQEESIMKHHPRTWRAACKTIVGADNKESTIRIRLRPQTYEAEDLHLSP